jgi:hypothetical protein
MVAHSVVCACSVLLEMLRFVVSYDVSGILQSQQAIGTSHYKHSVCSFLRTTFSMTGN